MHKHLITGVAWFMAFWLSIGWQIVPFAPGGFIKPAHAADPDMIIFMDYADMIIVPTNWEVISDSVPSGYGWGDPFLNRYVRGGGTYGAQGGAATHTHTLTYAGEGGDPTAGNNMDKNASGTTISLRAHTHGALANQSITTNDNLPNYRSLAVLRYTLGGIPATLPDNTILLFETATISGNWELYSAQDARLLRGGASTANAGNNTPTHTVASGLGAASLSLTAGTGTGVFPAITHTHSAGAGVASDGPSIIPSYYELVFQRATAAITSFPNNMIAGFSGTAFDSPSWTVVSGTVQKYNSLFLMGDSSGDLTSVINPNHSHTQVAVTSGAPVGTVTRDDSPANSSSASGNGHTHANVLINLQANVDHTPLYTDLVLAQYTAADTLDVTAPANVTLATDVHPGENTPDYTFAQGTEDVTVIDGTSNAWSLTVISTSFTSAGSSIIAASNVKLKTNNNLGTTPTTRTGGADATLTETNFTTGQSIDTDQEIVAGSASADGSYAFQPTFFIVIPPDATVTDYTAQFTFTVA